MKQKLFTRNFTLLVLGQASSLFGNLIVRFALSMYVLEATGSAAVFAGILAVATVPTILLSPLGGILADRVNRRNSMVALDALTGISVLAAALLFSPARGVAVITALLVILSVLGAFETPTVQACVPQMQTGDNIIRGNAVVNQIAAVSTLTAPIFGSVLYVAWGIKIVMTISIFFFFMTAALECGIKLESILLERKSGIWAILKNDFTASMHFMLREQPGIFKMLLLTAAARFFVMGAAVVGLPYLVRNVLGLSAAHYGAAESALAVAAIFGSIAAGALITKLKLRQLSSVLAALGACLVPAGVAFLLPLGTVEQYGINVAAFCGVQIAATIFSIFAVSVIQQKTPSNMVGKIMAYTAAITLCVQPVGQVLYGVLFDVFHDAVFLVLIPTGVIVCILGQRTKKFFKGMEQEQSAI